MKEEKAIYEYLKRYHRGREKAVCSIELERLFCLTGRVYVAELLACVKKEFLSAAVRAVITTPLRCKM